MSFTILIHSVINSNLQTEEYLFIILISFFGTLIFNLLFDSLV